MLDTFDKTDNVNAKAKAKKIIAQYLKKEVLGQRGEKKGLEDMAYAHDCLVQAFKNKLCCILHQAALKRLNM